MTFAERLKQRRNELGLTQAELAKKAELTLRTIQNYEGGTRKPLNIEMVQRLAVALATTTEYFDLVHQVQLLKPTRKAEQDPHEMLTK